MKLIRLVNNIITKRIPEILIKIRDIIEGIYSGDAKYNKKIINIYRVLVASTKKFLEDDCFTKASAIAYTTLISLIPTLTVILTFYSIFQNVGDKKIEVFAQVTTFMSEHNIKLNIDPILEGISSLIENAGKIGGIGGVIMIFTATAVLRTLDKSLNDIWNIKKGRSMFLKIVYFWTTLTLGPVLIIAGSTLANQVISMVSSPDYYSGTDSPGGRIWAVGNKASIIYSDSTGNRFNELPHSKIDFENQDIYHFDESNNSFVKQDTKIEEKEFSNAGFTDIQFIDNSGWIVGKNGYFLFTDNGARSWSLKKIGSLEFNDIHMINRSTGYIAANNGYLLATDDGWQSWNILEWEGITSNLRSISFHGKHGIITGDRGLVITTNDDGATWNYSIIPEAMIKKSYVNINHAFYINENRIVMACDDGLILFSNDSGKTWDKRSYYNRDYNKAYFTGGNKGFIAGDKGILIYTDNGGQNWSKKDLSISNINSLSFNNGDLWAFGNNGMALKSADNGKTWEGQKGRNVILYLTNFFAPLVYIWILFLLIYRFFPNTRVPFKPAAIGAAFTGTIWVVFTMLFEVYINSFSKGTIAIYGALAAIPLFLLMVYSSFLIVLYGAEVSYILMHPHLYSKLKKASKGRKDIHLYYGIAIMQHIYRKFESGDGSSQNRELLKITSGSDDELNYFIEIFKKENFITETADGFIPANSSRNIYISDIMALIHDVALYVPGIVPARDKLKKLMEDIFNKMKNSKEEIVKGMSLADLIERTK